jgi:hypothetical protein
MAWITKNSIEVLLVHKDDDGSDFRENVNVVVEDRELPLNDSTLNSLEATLPNQYESMGGKVEDLNGRIERVGLNQAVVMEYRITFSARPAALRQKQVLIPGGGRTYIVTCSAQADTFANHARSFDDILASIKVPPPVNQGFDWSRVWSRSMSGAMIGAVCAVIVGLIVVRGKKFAGTKNRTASSP